MRLFIAIFLLIFLSGCAGTFNNGLYVVTGLDYAGSGNPICGDRENGNNYGYNDAVTSNLGMRYELYKSQYDRFRVNITGTHHSCVFNNDKTLYDAGGFNFEWSIF